MIEQWDTMTARHKREKLAVVLVLRDQGLTQTQAAQRLKMKLTHLNGFIKREGIHWPVIRQGVRTEKSNGVAQNDT